MVNRTTGVDIYGIWAILQEKLLVILKRGKRNTLAEIKTTFAFVKVQPSRKILKWLKAVPKTFFKRSKPGRAQTPNSYLMAFVDGSLLETATAPENLISSNRCL